jgi:hypothetical protein
LAATELGGVTAFMDRRADPLPMTLTSPTALRIHPAPEVDVTSLPAALLTWLSGRGDYSGLHSDGAALPAIPPPARLSRDPAGNRLAPARAGPVVHHQAPAVLARVPHRRSGYQTG